MTTAPIAPPPQTSASPSPNSTAAPAGAAPSPEMIRRVAEEFEAMVLGQLLQPMFASLATDSLGGGGAGEELFRPLLVNEYATGVARGGGVGLAEHLVRELTRMQETQSQTGATDGADRR